MAREFPTLAATCAITVALTGALAGCPSRSPSPPQGVDTELGPRPRIVLFVGDGMGKNQEEIASRFAHGAPNQLAMHGLPARAEVLTPSRSGLVDSAAAATAMSSGVLTDNGTIALDRDDNEVETVFETATKLGLETGLVTTTSLAHATPASFAAHRPSRGQLRLIAEDYVMRSRPAVMLGGGAAQFIGNSDEPSLLPMLESQGYRLVRSRSELTAVNPATTKRLFGTFANGHLPYVVQRENSPDVPDLGEMTRAAIAILNQAPKGFVLVVEGGRIDHAGHGNRVDDVIADTLEFDAVIAETLEWAQGESDVTILVTADHETGGLDALEDGAKGEVPRVGWRWGSHTNRRVHLYGMGPNLELIEGVVDHRTVFAIIYGAVTGAIPIAPPRAILSNGYTGELRYRAASQSTSSNFGDRGGLNIVRVDADTRDVVIGLDGTFSFGDSAVTLLVDVNFGTSVGAEGLVAAAAETENGVDQLLSRLALPFDAPGFAPDFAAVTIGGAESRPTGPIGLAGWRSLASNGTPVAAAHRGVATNFDDGVRTYDATGPGTPRSRSGVEFGIPLGHLFPDGLPVGATIAFAAVLTSADGGQVSNQMLPSGDAARVRQVVVVELDRDRDGIVDDELDVSLAPTN